MFFYDGACDAMSCTCLNAWPCVGLLAVVYTLGDLRLPKREMDPIPDFNFISGNNIEK